MVERADVSEDPLLGVLAHGAGVDDDDIGLIFVGRERAAHLAKIAAYALAVALVLLTAVGIHQRLLLRALAHEAKPQALADLLLPRYLLPGYLGSVIHKTAP